MKKLLAGAVLSLAAATSWATPPSAESVETLLQVARAESMTSMAWTAMDQVMRQSMQQATAGQNLTPEQRRQMDAVPPTMTRLIREELSWSSMKPDFVALYREVYTQEEIDAQIAFYRSPAGQSILDKTPAVMQRSIALTQARMQAFYPRLKAALEQALAEARQPR